MNYGAIAGAVVKDMAKSAPHPTEAAMELTPEAAKVFARMLENPERWVYMDWEDDWTSPIYPRFGHFMECDWSGYGPFGDNVRIAPANVEVVRQMVAAANQKTEERLMSDTCKTCGDKAGNYSYYNEAGVYLVGCPDCKQPTKPGEGDSFPVARSPETPDPVSGPYHPSRFCVEHFEQNCAKCHTVNLSAPDDGPYSLVKISKPGEPAWFHVLGPDGFVQEVYGRTAAMTLTGQLNAAFQAGRQSLEGVVVAAEELASLVLHGVMQPEKAQPGSIVDYASNLAAALKDLGRGEK